MTRPGNRQRPLPEALRKRQLQRQRPQHQQPQLQQRLLQWPRSRPGSVSRRRGNCWREEGHAGVVLRKFRLQGNCFSWPIYFLAILASTFESFRPKQHTALLSCEGLLTLCKIIVTQKHAYLILK